MPWQYITGTDPISDAVCLLYSPCDGVNYIDDLPPCSASEDGMYATSESGTWRRCCYKTDDSKSCTAYAEDAGDPGKNEWITLASRYPNRGEHWETYCEPPGIL